MKAAFLLLLLPVLLGALTIAVVDESGAPLADVAISDGHSLRLTDATGQVFLPTLSPDSLLVFTRVDRIPRELTVAEATAEPVVLMRSPLSVTGIRVTASPATRVLQVSMNETRPLAAVLAELPEVTSTEAPLAGREQTVGMQGGKARHVRVELDGVTLNRSGQAFDLSSIPSANIERIEVVTGPVPGSAGMDGAIRLYSRIPQDNSFTAQYKAGSFGLCGEGMQSHFADDRLAISLGGSRETADNNFRFTNPFSGEQEHRSNNDTREDNINLSLGILPLHIASMVNLRRFERGLPGPINQTSLYDAARLNGEVDNLRVKFSSGRLAVRLYAENERIVYDNRTSSLPTYRAWGVTRTSLRQASVEGGTSLLGFNVQAGADLRRETFVYDDRLNASASLDEQTLVNAGAECSLERKWSKPAFEVRGKVSGRGDMPHREVGERLASRGTARAELAFAWKCILRPSLTMSAGNSFTLPSFYDLYWRGNSQAMGNPELKPERSRGADVRLAVGGETWELATAGTWRYYDDLIHWRNSTLGWKPVNLDAAEKRVFRLEGSWSPWTFIALHGDWQRIYAWDRSLNDDGSHADHWGKNLTNTPTSQTKLGVEVITGEWQATVAWQRIGRRWATADNLWGAMPAYELVNVQVTWQPLWRGVNWQVSAGTDNLLDVDYEVFSSEPMPGIGWHTGLGAKW